MCPWGLSFEHFLPWIQKLILVYQDQEDTQNDQFIPPGTTVSKAYYTKKLN